MFGPFSSPLAKHLHRGAVASSGEGQHRLSFGSSGHQPAGSGQQAQRQTPPASITSAVPAVEHGEQLGVHSPTASPSTRSRLAQDAGATAAAAAAHAVDSPAAALQELAASKRRAAVAAAAAAMQSPAAAARPGQLAGWPLPAGGSGMATPRRPAGLSTPVAPSRLAATPGTAAAPTAVATPVSSSRSAGGSAARQAQALPRSSFKQQAAQMMHAAQQHPPAVGAAGAATPGSLGSGAQRQRPRPLLHQQQQAPPPAASLEEAMGQLQLQGSLAVAATPASTAGLKMRSAHGERSCQGSGACLFDAPLQIARPDLCVWSGPSLMPAGLLASHATPRATPAQGRIGAERAAAATPPQPGSTAAGAAVAATPLPLVTRQQAVEQPQWSPMVPSPAPASAQGAGLLGTVRKAPRDGASSAFARSDSSALAAMESGLPSPTAAAARTPAAPAGAAAAAVQREASFGELPDDPAQLRRQLQAIVPELTLTQVPAAVVGIGGAGGGSQPATARPAPLPDRGAAKSLLERMHKLQAAATELLQEQASASTCAGVAAGFRGLLPPAAAAGASGASGSSTAVAKQRQEHTAAAAGPGSAAAAKLKQLAQLRVAGCELAAHLA